MEPSSSEPNDGLTPAERADLDLDGTAGHIARGGFGKVALQFPDRMLPLASRAEAALQRRLRALGHASAALFVLADTSFDGHQVDFVAAQHLGAELVVHYGPVDLEAEGPLEVRFVLGRRPLGVGALAAAYAAAFAPDRRVLVVLGLPYQHAAPALAERLAASHPGALVAEADTERAAVAAPEPDAAAAAATAAASAAADGGDADGAAAASVARSLADGRLLGRRLPTALSDAELGECALLYVGADDDPTLANLAVLFARTEVHVCAPPAADADAAAGGEGAGGGGVVPFDGQTSKRMMRRYFLVQKWREAQVVGILIGTLSAAHRAPMLAALKALCRRSGRKHYVFMMGKLNAAKLANFAEVGVYVLLGSAEHALLDAKDFYRPVLTPYELLLALRSGEWTGEYVLDHARVLGRLQDDAVDAAAADGGGGGGGSDDEDAPPDVSLVTGRLIADHRHASRAVGGRARDADDAEATGGALAAAADRALVLPGERGLVASQARSGAEFLATRGYRGLEVRKGEDAPAVVVEGREGVASGFSGEGDREDLRKS